MSDVVISRWCRAVGAYRWMALALSAVLMATGFAAFTRDVTDDTARVTSSAGRP